MIDEILKRTVYGGPVVGCAYMSLAGLMQIDGEEGAGGGSDDAASEATESEESTEDAGAEETLLGGDGDGDPDGGDGDDADDDGGSDDDSAEGVSDNGEGDGDETEEYEDDPELSDEENAQKKKEFDEKKAKKKTEDDAEEDIDPASYEITVPNGFNLDEELATEFRSFAAERRFSQEDVDRLTDIQRKLIEKQAKNTAEMKREWNKQLKEDKEFGGTQFDKNTGRCRAVIDTVFVPLDKDFKKMLNHTGLGSHPGFVRGMKRIADAFGEAGIEVANIGASDDDMETVLYGKETG